MRKKEVKTRLDVEKPKLKKPANLTQEEAALFERVKAEGQDRDWERVTEKDAIDFKLAKDPLRLPDFALKLKERKEYVFRWIERKKERIDEIRSMAIPFKWWIVNASTMPESVKDLDPILGCVCKLDQLLVFKPYWMHLKKKEIEDVQIEGKATAGELKSKHGVAVDEAGSQFIAGKEARIGGKDAVQWHETEPGVVADSDTAVVGEATAFEAGDSVDLGDLVAEE